MPYVPVDRVEVHLWGLLVGVAALDPAYGFYAVAYDPAFRDFGIDLAPLHMPLHGQEVFLFPDLPINTYKRLPALLADALPDDFGNALINSYMAGQGVSPSEVTALDRLAYMGSRAMGALTFKPARGPRARLSSAIDMRKLVTAAREAVHGAIDDDEHTNAALRSIIDVGTSAGGARAKAVVAVHPESKELRSGQVDAPPGFEHWLLKFDGVGMDKELGASQNYGRIEFAYHLMACAAGIQMSECDLLEENGRAHFMTRRFDRHGSSGRHHIQTLCAMQHLDYKLKGVHAYEQFFLTMAQLGLPYEDRVEGFRRMVFNVAGMNCDDHVKNLSFLLPEDDPAWRLAPAYDLTFAHNPQGEWTHQHLMSVNGKFKQIERADLLSVADRFGIRRADRLIDEVQEAVQLWPVYADAAGVPDAEIAFIERQLVRLT